MKIFITALLIAAFSFTSSFALAEKPIDKKADVSWLYVYVSEKGKIVKTDNGYTLILNRKDLTNILMFSDRPARLTKHVTAKELDKTWNVGKNSFEKDHPNAAVVIGGKTQTVQLAGMNITKDAVEFPLKSDGATKIQAIFSGPAVIFIDGHSLQFITSYYTFVGGMMN